MKQPERQLLTPGIMKGRLERFALDVLSLTRPLLHEVDSRDLALQLRRAATGAYSNYGAACVARSHADFTSKMGIAFKEMDESRRWLQLLKTAEMLKVDGHDGVLRESKELRAILSSTHLTAKRNREKYRRQGR